ncbi:MAG TPA: MFS transporter, partial [Solirubrobacteraceae bacterium]|nr:MFS transporter [Solirubrobacteraceae bacterium]
MRSAIRSPRLRRILLAYSVNELGTWFGYVALAVGVYDHTHSALAVAGVFIAGRLLPSLLTPALVARVEASRRRSELSGLYLLEALVAVALALMLSHFWLPLALLLVAIDGTAALAASALLRAAVARIAAEEAEEKASEEIGEESIFPAGREAAIELAQRRANAALNVAFTLTVATGPAIAGVLVALAGGPTALLIDAASFLLCGAILIDLHPHVEEAGGSSVRARLIAGLEHLRSVPQLRALLIAQAVAVACFASVEPIEIVYAKSTLHVGDRGFGLLIAAWGLGMVLGGLLFARTVRQPLSRLLAGSALLVGVAYLAAAAAPDLAVACGAGVIGGIGNGLEVPALISAVQRLTPPRLQGRMMGVVES